MDSTEERLKMKCILYAEDDPNDVFIMRRAMKTAGIKNPLQVVDHGQAAIDYLDGNGQYADRGRFPLPCLMLLDMKLPYLSGLEVMKWIRRESSMPTLLVVFMTSSREEMDIDQAYRLGANAYLVKPPDSQKLAEMLEALKNFWLTHNQFPPDCFPITAGVSRAA